MAQRLKITPIGIDSTYYQRSPCYHAGCTESVTLVHQSEVSYAGPTLSRFLPTTGDIRREIKDPTINLEAIFVNKNGRNILSIYTCKTHLNEVERTLETLRC